MVVTKPRIIKPSNEPKLIEQKIIEVHNHFVKVISRKGNTYDVNLSDRVRMTMTVEVGDTAIINPLDNGWLVVDLVKKPVTPKLSKEQEDMLQQELESLLGEY